MLSIKRINFLKNKYNIAALDEKIVESMLEEQNDVVDSKTLVNKDLGMLFFKMVKFKKRLKTKIIISEKVLDLIIDSDPTNNKENVDWMLSVFINLVKKSEYLESERFINEDIPLAKEYLDIFIKNKRKRIFSEYCSKSFILKDISDYSNINQYNSLSELYDAVEPFIIRDKSNMYRLLEKYVNLGEASMPFKSKKYTVFIPKTIEANYIFKDYVTWCTTIKGNNNFKTCTNNKKPNGDKSNIYIVINNDFFTDKDICDDSLYQIHFESNQTKNRKQNDSDFYNAMLIKCDKLRDYFKVELMNMANQHNLTYDNLYVDFLISYGYSKIMFDLMKEDTKLIKFINKKLPKVGHLSKFKKLKQLIICDCELSEIDGTLSSLDELEFLSLSANKIKKLPENIGKLKKIKVININDNPIKIIPESIKFLDKTRGGSLTNIMVSKKDIGSINYNRLEKLLPSVKIN